MEGGGFSPYSNLGNFTETAMDLDFMDELLFDGCWIETTDGNNFKQSIPSTSTSTAANDLSFFNPSQNSRTAHLGMSPLHNIPEEEPYRKRFLPSPPHMKIEELVETHPTSREVQESSITSVQSGKFFVQGTELGKRLWIPPNVSSGFSVKDRLVQAIGYLQDVLQDKDFLIQIWVPVEKGGKKFLTTKKQPYIFNPDFVSLERYRLVSENYSFPADEDSRESVGMPGRVFLGKLPEWTPDVQFFRSEEYPRIKFAQEYDVRGSLALPVFERASGTCLGVVEIVTTTQRINYRPELENICKALEAVDLSSNNLSPPSIKFPQVCNEPYEAALREISELLTCICRSHGLPLALTWAPCVQQGKFGSRHSDENYSRCVSTIDSVCFVPDADSQNFLEACSEHHLLQGEGIVGRAFKTKKRCFATDVTAFSKLNYPLVHHAKIFGLHAALAIPLSNSYTGSVELVLELFFPRGCIDTVGQKQMLNSLSAAMQQEFRSLYLVMDKEIEEEVILPVRETTVFANQSLGEEENKRKSSALEEVSPEESLWIAHMMEANKKGKGVSLSWEYQKEEPKEEFKLMTHWDRNRHDPGQRHVVTEHGQYQQNPEPKISFDGSGESFSSGFHSTLGNRRPGERRRTKTEKSIGLEVLRQYFAGSLKDAAKSIGVCPTTLKRICRQHGITRWPSRKIKKVGHSLRKLQLVIDSVQGVEGSIQLGSFYTSFPELSSPNFSAGSGPSKTNDNLNQSSMQTENGLFPSGGSTAPKSPSSSCSQSSGSSTCCSTGANKSANTRNGSIGINPKEAAKTSGTILKRIRSDAELHIVNQEKPKVLARTQSHKTFPERPNLETQPQFPVPSSSRNLKSLGAIKVKALFGESKVRLSLQANWGYRDLQQEIGRRFYIEDISRFDLKYLDDDREWVLLTCDDDLEECIDIYRAYPNRTIKIAVQQASQHKLGSSLGSTGPS